VEGYDLFTTTVWSTDLDLDLDKLRREVFSFSKTQPSVNFSNAGGYQGHCFDYKPLINAIKDNVPRYENPELGHLHITAWVNINGKGAYNTRHTHADGINLLSGVYYVTVPENSGSIVFFDPRPPIFHSMADMRYYGQGRLNNYKIEARENRLLYFPSWLEHEVEPNNNDEDRISISFNLIRKKDIESYQEILNYS
tara:strand:+ start:115 stop:702 length:588 start_codon:yes stop_codon:yes gene_type:complete